MWQQDFAPSSRLQSLCTSRAVVSNKGRTSALWQPTQLRRLGIAAKGSTRGRGRGKLVPGPWVWPSLREPVMFTGDINHNPEYLPACAARSLVSSCRWHWGECSGSHMFTDWSHLGTCAGHVRGTLVATEFKSPICRGGEPSWPTHPAQHDSLLSLKAMPPRGGLSCIAPCRRVGTYLRALKGRCDLVQCAHIADQGVPCCGL